MHKNALDWVWKFGIGLDGFVEVLLFLEDLAGGGPPAGRGGLRLRGYWRRRPAPTARGLAVAGRSGFARESLLLDGEQSDRRAGEERERRTDPTTTPPSEPRS